MTDYEYDEDLPYVVEYLSEAVARFREFDEADAWAGGARNHRIIDTSPKPRVPEDALWVAYPAYGPGKHETWELSLASRGEGGDLWFAGGSDLAVPLEDLPGVTPDTVFTVLDEREKRND